MALGAGWGDFVSINGTALPVPELGKSTLGRFLGNFRPHGPAEHSFSVQLDIQAAAAEK